jgi:predicted GNAT family acetyltransferase
MDTEVRHDGSNRRFETVVEGVPCVLEYQLRGNTMRIVHTSVPPAVGGRGIASQLVRAAFDAARRQGWRVEPACSYAEVWAGRHPEYADVLVSA